MSHRRTEKYFRRSQASVEVEKVEFRNEQGGSFEGEVGG